MLLKPVLLPFGKTIYQTDQGQSISTDNVFLVELIRKRVADIKLQVLDLGCGNGILSIMMGYYKPAWQITGLEIQAHLVELANSNVNLAGLTNIELIEADLRSWDVSSSFDLIISNPPYFKADCGKLSPLPEKAISTHEVKCSMQDIFNFLKKYLKPSGEAYIIYPKTRSEEIQKYAKKVDLNIKTEFFLNNNKKKRVVFLLTKR